MTTETAVERAEITKDDANVIRFMMEEFYLDGTLNPDETRVFMALCSTFGFGRPVPPHGSGP